MLAREIADQLLDLVFPTQCLGCRRSCQGVLCRQCLSLALVGRGEPDSFADGLPRDLRFAGFRAAGPYGGLLKEMVVRLKSSQRPFSIPLSRLMIAAAGNDPCYLAPAEVFYVPSDRARVAKRGFNPAELLASEVAGVISRPVNRGLRKVKRIRDQDSLTARARWENVRGAFAVDPGAGPEGNVLLVDDILTTGATADACSAALLEAGAAAVRVLVACRVVMGFRLLEDHGAWHTGKITRKVYRGSESVS